MVDLVMLPIKSQQKKVKSVSVLRAGDLDALVRVLCNLLEVGSFNLEQFKKIYEHITHREITFDTAEDYFYSATKWRLILKERNGYHVSRPEFGILCRYLEEGKESEIKNLLFNLLMNREPAFSAFINFLKNKPTLNELKEKFNNPHTLTTLLEWATWLGKISQSTIEQKYYPTPTARQKSLSLEQFWRLFKAAYDRLRKTELVGVRSAYVKVPDLQDLCCFLKELTCDEFDKQLRLLLITPPYSQKIELSGAPVAYITQEMKKKQKRRHVQPSKFNDKVFEFNNKKYYFVAIKEKGEKYRDEIAKI